MADISSQVTQAAAPGSLLRTVAESQTQDPSKVQQNAQVGSPIRNLVQNPIESSIPASTPRVLSETPATSPSPDFSGLHSMLSSTPVPPPHVAAQLIRAMMTPPGQGHVVAASSPYVPPPSVSTGGGAGVSGVQPASAPQPPAQSVSTPRPAQTATPVSRPLAGASFNPAAASAGLTYSPAPQQHSAPQTRQNVLGGNPFIGGILQDVGTAAEEGLGGLRGGEGGFASVPNPLYNHNQSLIQNVQNSPLGRLVSSLFSLF